MTKTGERNPASPELSVSGREPGSVLLNGMKDNRVPGGGKPAPARVERGPGAVQSLIPEKPVVLQQPAGAFHHRQVKGKSEAGAEGGCHSANGGLLLPK